MYHPDDFFDSKRFLAIISSLFCDYWGNESDDKVLAYFRDEATIQDVIDYLVEQKGKIQQEAEDQMDERDDADSYGEPWEGA